MGRVGAFAVLPALLLLAAVETLSSQNSDRFSEELFVSPLSTGHVYLHFKFSISTPLRSKYVHMDYFPKSVIDIVQAHNVRELHVRLTQGAFRHEKWGYPILSAPSGAEVWAWFQDDASSIADKWRGLTNSLAGLLCATFNDISSVNSISPQWNFRPEGLVDSSRSVNTSLLRYSMLPRENLCTENLTPWKKLLPCYDRAGLAKLLNAVKLLSAHYFNIAFDVKPVCGDPECHEQRLQLEVSATAAVLPGSIEDEDKLNWSLRDLLEIDVDSGCPLATHSLVYVNQSMKSRGMVFYPAPTYFTVAHEEDIAVYDLRNTITFPKPQRNIGGKSSHAMDYTHTQSPFLEVHRYVSGVGQQYGGIKCLMKNNNPDVPVTVSYMEIVPWFLRLYFHTIRLQDLEKGTPVPITRQHFVLARDRQLPHHIELLFTIPPATTVELSVEFDYTLLKWTEYPPDANHGFHIPPAVISARLADCQDFQFPKNFTQLRSTENACFLRLYTKALLVSLPTPDFSMPYNVICMTCTVLALAFGPIHAITTKRFVVFDPQKHAPPLKRLKTVVAGVMERVKGRLRRWRGKNEEHKE
ncbi:GPI transamidase component PIG-T-like [Paramacrobiotus metropolitanus]|uniref:GPI transamidase component PIG-T-like n=1 Tax=Paramacrobiotus metropolitanus TaxID=2943436 RepID=UPI0024460B4A|nr:GPI transamidase component PIG-T-like [Paramacrobiotus metropolitanus]